MSKVKGSEYLLNQLYVFWVGVGPGMQVKPGVFQCLNMSGLKIVALKKYDSLHMALCSHKDPLLAIFD